MRQRLCGSRTLSHRNSPIACRLQRAETAWKGLCARSDLAIVTVVGNREGVSHVGTGALDMPLLSQSGLELGLGLIHDDRAHEPGLELDGENADLLSI